MDRLLTFTGRLHPLVLHLPIGIAVALGALEVLRRRDSWQGVRVVLAWLLALSAAVTAATGLALGEEEPDAGDTFYWHKRAGICFAIVAVFAAAAVRRWPRFYRVLLALGLALLLPAGHLGASLTHGENWLTGPLQALLSGGATPHAATDAAGGSGAGVGRANATGASAERAASGTAAADAAQGSTASAGGAPAGPVADYAAVVAPIFAARCGNCHGETRQRGGLDLRTPESIAAGGKHGPVIDVATPATSELLRRVALPLDDEDHMPPEAKPQPEPREEQALEAWIGAGAPFTGHVPALAPFLNLPVLHASADTAGPGAAIGEAASDSGDPIAGDALADVPEPPTADAAALAALRAALVHVQPVAAGSARLWIDFAAVSRATTDATAAALLEPVVAQVVDLSLARCDAGDALLLLIARMPRMERLDLSGTRVTSAGLGALAGHERLAELVLASTKLDAGAVDALLALPALRSVRLWDAGLDEAALARLRAARPGLDVDAGTDGESVALEVEPPVAVAKAGAAAATSPAPAAGTSATEPSVIEVGATSIAVGAPGAAGGKPAVAASLAPVNATCPVSGNPVNAAFLLVDQGRVIGFCCKDCPGRFLADPERYRPLVK